MILKIIEKYEDELFSLYTNGMSTRVIPNYVKGSIKICEAQALYSIIRNNKYEDIIDVGTGPGFSAMYFAQALKDEGIESKVQTIDTGPNISMTTGVLKEFSLEGYVNFIVGSSTDVLPSFKPESYDFVLIDGEHSYEQTKIDFENSYKLLRPGGCIAFHDVYPRPENSPGSRNVVEEFAKELGDVVFFPEEVFDFFKYREDIEEYYRLVNKWERKGYGRYVTRSANPKETMAVFFKK